MPFPSSAPKPDSKRYPCRTGAVCCGAHQQTGAGTEGERSSRETRGMAQESTIGMYAEVKLNPWFVLLGHVHLNDHDF